MMGMPVVVVAAGGLPVVTSAAGYGVPLEEAANGRGVAVTLSANGRGLPVIWVGSGAMARVMPAANGAVTLTGQTVFLRQSNLPLVAAQGAVALTGQAVVLAVKLPAAQASFTMTGQAVTLTKTTAASSWPDASNTGTSGTLTSHSGDFNTSSNNQVVNSINASGSIVVNHSGVTVSNCSCDTVMINAGGANCIVEDCTIIGTGSYQETGVVISGAGSMVRRNDISGCENGVYMDAACTVRDNWLHDWASPGAPETPHFDGIATQGGASNMLVEHNYIDGVDQSLSSCMFIQADSGPINNITVNNNKFIGGGYTCYAFDKNSHGMSGIVYTNNRLDGWFYGPLYGPYTIATWTGNVVDSTGASIPLA